MSLDNTAFPVGAAPFTSRIGLTKREYAAIKLRVPDSGSTLIDAMILKSLKNELAAKILQGEISRSDAYEEWNFSNEIHRTQLALMCNTMANAMIAENAK